MKKITVIIPAYNSEQTIKAAIESIPKRDDIEVIVVDDGSTDQTGEIAENIIGSENVIHKPNGGVASAVNIGLNFAKGEYVVLLGSDDYFYTNTFEQAIQELDGTDLVYFNLETNDGTIFRLTPDTKYRLCGSTKFMRRDFIGNIREEESLKAREDWFFFIELQKQNPTEKYTDLIIKHYNYPREGSLSDKARKGEI